jgi:16S rRNA (guanine(966)-N(2))-methyltransferase RsmD
VRIIAGKYRGRNLNSPASLATRPTSDRLRETLFNILAPKIAETRFLDLCAGSGAVGIEALSRGAAHVTFVDSSPKMTALIRSNLALCGVSQDESRVVTGDALKFLRKKSAASDGAWDIIFFDPPYADDYDEVLETLGEFASRLLANDVIVIIEHYHKKQLSDSSGNLERYRVVKQGESSLSFYRKASE